MSGEIRGKYGAGNKVNTKYKRSKFFHKLAKVFLFIQYILFFF